MENDLGSSAKLQTDLLHSLNKLKLKSAFRIFYNICALCKRECQVRSSHFLCFVESVRKAVLTFSRFCLQNPEVKELRRKMYTYFQTSI